MKGSGPKKRETKKPKADKKAAPAIAPAPRAAMPMPELIKRDKTK